MTEDSERELTPEEDARIRSLLASARASDRVPDDVASRLDSVLADLASGRDADDDRPTQPRWRKGRMFLAAAASVARRRLGRGEPAAAERSRTTTRSGSSRRRPTTAPAPRLRTRRRSSGERAGRRHTKCRRGCSTDSFRRDVTPAAGRARSRLPTLHRRPHSGPDAPAPSDELASDPCAGVSRRPGVVPQSPGAAGREARAARGVRASGTVRVWCVQSPVTAPQTLATTRIPAD